MSDDRAKNGSNDELEGLSKQVEGRVRNAVGGLTGDTSEQLKGKAKDLEGNVQRKAGEAERDESDSSR
jgi:uncharacterized protein YjbJ (UPF0337 family)